MDDTGTGRGDTSMIIKSIMEASKFIIKKVKLAVMEKIYGDKDMVLLQGMARLLSEQDGTDDHDGYIVVDKPTSFHMYPYRNNVAH